MNHPVKNGKGQDRYFKLDNEFVDDGSLAALKTLGELKTALVLLRYRNNDSGQAWPSLSTIAKKAGISRGHVSRAISALREKGLIAATIKPGQTTRKSTTYLVRSSLPGATAIVALADPGSLLGATSTAAPAQPVSLSGATQRALRAQPTRPPGAARQILRQEPWEKDHQQHDLPIAAVDHEAASMETSRRAALLRELDVYGIQAMPREAALSRRGLTAVDVRLLALEACKKARESVVGLLCSYLMSNNPPRLPDISPELVAQLANDLHIVAVNGHRLTQRVKYGKEKLLISNGDGKQIEIRSADLQKDRLELSSSLPRGVRVAGEAAADAR